MLSPDRLKPYAPDVHAVVRLEEALPPEPPVHVFVDRVRSIDLDHFVIAPGPRGGSRTTSYGRMRQREAQLRDEIARLVERAEARDAAEDQAHGADSGGYSVHEQLALQAARLAKIRALRERLEADKRAEQGLAEDAPPAIDDTEQRSPADGDARMMLLKRGEYGYAYNAQAAVDAESGAIVAADLTNVAPDIGHLPALVTQVRALREVARIAEETPTTVSADAGYFSGDNVAEDGAGLDLLIAAGRDDPAAAGRKTGVYSVDRFGYDAA